MSEENKQQPNESNSLGKLSNDAEKLPRIVVSIAAQDGQKSTDQSLMDRVHQQYDQEGSARAAELQRRSQAQEDLLKRAEITHRLQTVATGSEHSRMNEIDVKVQEVLTPEQMKFMQSDRDVSGILLSLEGKVQASNTISLKTDDETRAWQVKKGVLDAQRVDGVLVVIYDSDIAVPEGLPDISKEGRSGQFDQFRELTYTDVRDTYSYSEHIYRPDWLLQTTRHEIRHALVSHQDAVLSEQLHQNQRRLIDQSRLRADDPERLIQLSYLDELHSQYLDVIEGELEERKSFRSADSQFYSIEKKGTHEEVASDTSEGKQAARELFYGLQAMILFKRMSEQNSNIPEETAAILVYASGAVLGTERSVVAARDKIVQLWNLVAKDQSLSTAFSSFIEGYTPSQFDNTPVISEGLQAFLTHANATLIENSFTNIDKSEESGKSDQPLPDLYDKNTALHDQRYKVIFADEEHKRYFFNNLDIKGFSSFLNRLNGSIRGKKKEDWDMDGEKVRIESMFLGVNYVPPSGKDKLELLDKVLTTTKTMIRENRSYNDIALLLSSSLNALHLYADGNGRMSRVLYLLLTNNHTEETMRKSEIALSEDGRNLVDINPSFIQSQLEKLIETEVGIGDSTLNPDNITNIFSAFNQKHKPEFNSTVSEEDKKLFLKLNGNSDGRRYLFWSIFLFFRDNPDLDINKYTQRFENRSAILTADLIKDLNPEQLKQIFTRYDGLKRRYVEKLIDSIAHPDKEEYAMNEDVQKISLKAYFENKIREASSEKEEDNGVLQSD